MKHYLHGVWALMCATALYGCPSDAAISAAGASANLCQSDSECASGVCGSSSQPGVCVGEADDRRRGADEAEDADDEHDESSNHKDACACNASADRDEHSDEHHDDKAQDRSKHDGDGDDDGDCDEDRVPTTPCSCPPPTVPAAGSGGAGGAGGTGGAAGAPAVIPPQ
jgi:hypothetical protein